MKPGEILYATQPVTINAGRRTLRLRVHNTGDRPIQVGSHFHFFEVNRALDFEREQAFGMRLNILAATSVRFEPGDEKEVELVEIGGMRRLVGFNGLVNGAITARVDRQSSYRTCARSGVQRCGGETADGGNWSEVRG